MRWSRRPRPISDPGSDRAHQGVCVQKNQKLAISPIAMTIARPVASPSAFVGSTSFMRLVYPGVNRHRIAEPASMTITLDRTWAFIAALAVVACLAIYWQARAVERKTRVLPDDLSLQLEDVGVGIGDQGNLARP
jgi:H+/gluconate symporter-like permease